MVCAMVFRPLAAPGPHGQQALTIGQPDESEACLRGDLPFLPQQRQVGLLDVGLGGAADGSMTDLVRLMYALSPNLLIRLASNGRPISFCPT